MAKITQPQLQDLLEIQWQLYQRQDAYGIGPDCKATMDAVQKVMRTLATDTPDPSGPFADLKWRQANVGSWAAFGAPFFSESNALKAAYPDLDGTISLLNNYYGPSGFGNVNGYRVGNDFFYFDILTQQPLPDINGAADAMILTQPGNPNHVAPPSLNIP